MKVNGEERWHALQIPECGIDFQRYRSDDYEAYICAWRDDSNSHVYEVRCRKVRGAEAANQDAIEQWVAELSNDGRKLCSLTATGKHVAYMLGLGAMRAYLRRGHRKTLRAEASRSGNAEGKAGGVIAVSRFVQQLGRLRYAGFGQIMREADSAPISLIDVVMAYNELWGVQQAYNIKAAEPLSPEEELADTVARQNEVAK